ncbi:lytic murein transglycosylase B [Methylomagnum sp.]
MHAKLFRVLALTVGILLEASCSHTPRKPLPRHTPQPTPTIPEPQSQRGSGDAGGQYSARYLTGDYSGYPALERFIDKMVSEHGYSRDYLYGLFSQARRKQWTLDYLGREPKPTAAPRPGSWTRYRAQFLTEKHIATGAAFWSRHAQALRRAQAEYGVSPEHIMGIMGVETIYGGNFGNHRIIDALTTLAMDYPRRAAYFAEELENFLVMAQNEGIDPSRPVGSYAGAMGLGQFMPSSFLKFAVDFDGDGRKDLWNPVDAIGSIASYFAGHGWRKGQPVVSPALLESPSARELECGLDKRYSFATLADYGIRPAVQFPADSVRLLRLSAAAGDEYWIGYENFYVITRYNHSTHYAMAVHQLAEAVRQRYSRLASAQ